MHNSIIRINTFFYQFLARFLTINILLFLKVRDFRILSGKSHNLIGQGIFHGDKKIRDLHEKSRDLSNYEIFQHKILKSQSFKKRAVYW